MCGLVAIHGDQLLSFACPKESNQRKDTLASAVTRASCPRDCASRLRGSPTVRPCTEVELAGILPAIASRLILHLLAAAERGPGRAKRGSPCRRSGEVSRIWRHVYRRRRRYAAHSKPVIPAKAGIHLMPLLFALGSPLSSGEGRTEKPRAPHAGGARDRADSAAGHGWPVSRTRSPAADRSLRERRGSEGAVFFGYFLLGKQKKVTGGHGWPTKHTRT